MIALSFQYTPEDCSRAWRRHFREKLHLPIDLAAIAGAGAYGVFRAVNGGFDALAAVMLLLSFFLACIVFLGLVVLPHQAYSRNEKLRRPYRLNFTEERIEFQTEGVESVLEWKMYQRVMSDRYAYLLYYGKDEFTILPARAFGSADERDAFERLLEQKPRWTSEKRPMVDGAKAANGSALSRNLIHNSRDGNELHVEGGCLFGHPV